MAATESVVVVTVNYRRLDDTLRCLRSVDELTGPSIKVVVVDTGESDDAELVSAAFPDVTVVNQRANLGFTGGSNVGMARALESEPDYVLLLNNDATVPPQFLECLLAEMRRDRSIGICGPTMLTADLEESVQFAGGTMDWKGRCFHPHDGEPYEAVRHGRPFDTDFLHGSALLIRSEVIKQVGLLDDRFFLNYEDVEYCYRVRAAGHRVVMVPEAHYWHAISASIGQNSLLGHYYLVRNRLLFLESRRRWLRLAGALGAAFVSSRRETDSDRRHMTGRAVRDFRTGRLGKADGLHASSIPVVKGSAT